MFKTKREARLNLNVNYVMLRASRFVLNINYPLIISLIFFVDYFVIERSASIVFINESDTFETTLRQNILPLSCITFQSSIVSAFTLPL